ncbi:MAG TPA: response regulator [Bryobacteraceae bacterium]|nr:response regulator [Bryobacteraceae bacterium]
MAFKIRVLNILLVEDNPGDVRLMKEALKEANVAMHVSVVNDGETALKFLRRANGYSDSPRPDLIFLDLNLPRRDGREILSEIKHDDELRRIPVVVLTTSEAERDIAGAYDLHANCYVKKPMDLDQFIHVVRECERFWLHIARLPRS